MDVLKKSFKAYLIDTLDIKTTPKKWVKENGLPLYLQDAFMFFEVEILNTSCLLMIASEESEQSPATVKKHIKKIQGNWDGEIIYVRRSISSYNRQRLIEHKVSFVVPDNQMYIPLLGIDLREHFRIIRSERKQLRPSAQVVVLCALFDRPSEKYTPKTLAKRLGYSSMALTRAFDELEFSGIGATKQEGRERILQFPESKRELWEKARTYMRSPVKKKVRVQKLEAGCNKVRSGLTALADYSMLSAPTYETYAISGKAWSKLTQNDKIKQIPPIETAGYELEIWNYDPYLFAKNEVADHFSLYLSLQNDNDERVQSALKEMMERVEW